MHRLSMLIRVYGWVLCSMLYRSRSMGGSFAIGTVLNLRIWYCTNPIELRILRLRQTGRGSVRLFMTTLAYLDIGCLVCWPPSRASRSALVCRAFVHSSLFLPSAEEMCRSAEKLVCAKSIDRSVRRARLVSANFHHRCWDLYLRVYNISCLPVASRR